MEPEEEDGDDEKSEEDSIDSVFASEETEPFEEGETAATPPPFRYRVAARISVQPHILMPFRSEKSESIPEADIPLQNRARFTTPTGGYEKQAELGMATATMVQDQG
nr:hypothetical protein [Tanacetum cinerariifolium]